MLASRRVRSHMWWSMIHNLAMHTQCMLKDTFFHLWLCRHAIFATETYQSFPVALSAWDSFNWKLNWLVYTLATFFPAKLLSPTNARLEIQLRDVFSLHSTPNSITFSKSLISWALPRTFSNTPISLRTSSLQFFCKQFLIFSSKIPKSMWTDLHQKFQPQAQPLL